MSIIEEEEPNLDRRRSDWALDEWDEVAEVPVVEPLRQQTRLVKWVVWIAFALVVMLIIVAGYVGWWYLDQTRPDTEPGDAVAFTVLETDTLDSLSTRLVDEGFVVDESVFKWYVERKGGLDLTPGFYQLPTGAHMGDVLARLRTPPGQTYFRVTFPEGFTIEQMAERLDESVEEALPGLLGGRFGGGMSDSRGHFLIDVEPGLWKLTAVRAGYAPAELTVEVSGGAGRDDLDLLLTPAEPR